MRPSFFERAPPGTERHVRGGSFRCLPTAAGAAGHRHDPDTHVRRRPADDQAVAASNSFRLAGRLQLNLLDAEKVYFLRGTWLGETRLLSFAGSYDFQYSGEGSYFAYSFDALLDADGLTAQLEYLYRDGGARLDLPVQTRRS
jgi:hypothetical protein